jgi:hypothetical protein
MKSPFTQLKLVLAAAALSLTAAATSQAAITVLTFEGLQDLEPVENYYNAGLGGNGSGPGAANGVVFSSNALAIIDADAGGSGNIGGEPSPDTVLFFLSGPAATLNYAAGFTTGFSFYYSAINNSGFVNVWDGLDATGTLLATIPLPTTPSDGGDPNGNFSPFFPVGVAFAGTAKSVDFGGTVNQIAFDNITFGSDRPGNGNAVPEGGTSVALLGLGLVGLVGASRRLKSARA